MPLCRGLSALLPTQLSQPALQMHIRRQRQPLRPSPCRAAHCDLPHAVIAAVCGDYGVRGGLVCVFCPGPFAIADHAIAC
jgi:hypothetical protein